jgi:hypothetical protein
LAPQAESNGMLDGTGVAATIGMHPTTEGGRAIIGRYKLSDQIGGGAWGWSSSHGSRSPSGGTWR